MLGIGVLGIAVFRIAVLGIAVFRVAVFRVATPSIPAVVLLIGQGKFPDYESLRSIIDRESCFRSLRGLDFTSRLNEIMASRILSYSHLPSTVNGPTYPCRLT